MSKLANAQIPKTIILSLGNPLRGDDGVGAMVLATLNEMANLPENSALSDVTLLEGGTPGLETVLLLEGYERAIIIDAAEMELPAGEWRRFMADEVRLKSRNLYLRGTLHYAGLAEALNLGEALGMLPPEIVIFGIQPAEIGWEPIVTPAVQAAVPLVCAAILTEVQPVKLEKESLAHV